jgi:NDP-sugar pyrophosphorylase family protein
MRISKMPEPSHSPAPFDFIQTVPKPIVDFANKPMIIHQIEV